MRGFLIKSMFFNLARMFMNIRVMQELRKELSESVKKRKEVLWRKEPNGVKWRNINGRQEMIIPARK